MESEDEAVDDEASDDGPQTPGPLIQSDSDEDAPTTQVYTPYSP